MKFRTTNLGGRWCYMLKRFEMVDHIIITVRLKELPLLLETLDTGAWKVLSASKISQMWQKRIWGGRETLFYYLKPHFSNGSGLGSFF